MRKVSVLLFIIVVFSSCKDESPAIPSYENYVANYLNISITDLSKYERTVDSSEVVSIGLKFYDYKMVGKDSTIQVRLVKNEVSGNKYMDIERSENGRIDCFSGISSLNDEYIIDKVKQFSYHSLQWKAFKLEAILNGLSLHQFNSLDRTNLDSVLRYYYYNEIGDNKDSGRPKMELVDKEKSLEVLKEYALTTNKPLIVIQGEQVRSWEEKLAPLIDHLSKIDSEQVYVYYSHLYDILDVFTINEQYRPTYYYQDRVIDITHYNLN